MIGEMVGLSNMSEEDKEIKDFRKELEGMSLGQLVLEMVNEGQRHGTLRPLDLGLYWRTRLIKEELDKREKKSQESHYHVHPELIRYK